MPQIRSIFGDSLLVRLTVGAQETPSGLIIPSSAQHMEPYGTVEQVGPEVKDIHVGDKVLVDDCAGTIFEEDRTTRLVLYREKNIVGILSEC